MSQLLRWMSSIILTIYDNIVATYDAVESCIMLILQFKDVSICSACFDSFDRELTTSNGVTLTR